MKINANILTCHGGEQKILIISCKNVLSRKTIIIENCSEFLNAVAAFLFWVSYFCMFDYWVLDCF